MKFESNILFSTAAHVVFIAAALFILGRDAVFRVPERYIQVTLIGNEGEAKTAPARGVKKAGQTLPVRRTVSRSRPAPGGNHLKSAMKAPLRTDKKAVARAVSTPLPKPQPEKPKASPHETAKDSTAARSKPALPGTEGRDSDARGKTAAISGAGGKPSGKQLDYGDSVATAGTGPSRPAGGGQGAKNGGTGLEGRTGEKGSYNAVSEIRAAIERAKRYPLFARDRGIEGKVTAEFSIDINGLPEDVKIKRSSGFKILDSAAKETIIRAAPFPVVRGKIEIPITFRLRREE
jgi:TonB family protein